MNIFNELVLQLTNSLLEYQMISTRINEASYIVLT